MATRSEPRPTGRGHAITAVLTLAAVGASYASGGAYDLWIKALHVMAVISWMAGLFYLPRLFIYHCGAQAGSVQSETFKVMEDKLYRIIMTPAMIVSWICGLYLAWSSFAFEGGWLHGKLLLVVLLSAYHGYLGGAVRRFAGDANRLTHRQWRMLNEVPTLLMVGIVLLVIVKPF
ncbi:putative membrane protein [Rhizobium sp. RU20A]|uniref:protoporphyrinogen oxidase HemJ n=1 Tax=Rhizobium sp. RU20A TaxID=1907412 RepID=UPI0009554DDA|nr:protoporphyrinogen oxidase HemJ [Rhizobium sp. RU20A]SIQ84629.1 putative membrane protein [Rhizobium sp. RU20A]